jgi:hypothetical protein
VRKEGFKSSALAIFFLEDLRGLPNGIAEALSVGRYFPLWKIDTGILVRDFLNVVSER